MFHKYDKFWFWARIAMYILLFLSLAGAIIVPVVCAVQYVNAIYFLYIIPALIVCVVMWIFFELFFGMLLDIKLIRNKLYNESNAAFLSEEEIRKTKNSQ